MINYSIVIPVYKNEENVPSLVQALQELSSALESSCEVIFVIDGSPDNSGGRLLSAGQSCSFENKVIFHSRNFGAFAAIRTGMEHASGRFIAAMAADLQEPPSLILDAFRILSSDQADVVFGQRMGRHDALLARILSNIFWYFYKNWVLPDIPKGGVDIFACNRAVTEAVLSIEEPNSSLVAQLFWVGFRRKFVPYVRNQRQIGKSSWSLTARFRYMMDSIFSYSDLPILVALWLGAVGCGISVVMAAITIVAKLSGYIEEAGYTSLLIMISFFGSLILLVQGILGCYVWRTSENSKKRPLRIVSHIVAHKPGADV